MKLKTLFFGSMCAIFSTFCIAETSPTSTTNSPAPEATSEAPVMSPQRTYGFDLGVHANYSDVDDFYATNTPNFKDESSAVQYGFDLAMYLRTDSLYSDTRVSLEYIYYGDRDAQASSLCNSQPCYRSTELQHQAIAVNLFSPALTHQDLSLRGFVGVSRIFAKGKIKDDAWKNSGNGLQVGARLEIDKFDSMTPFMALRFSWFEFEAAKTVSIIDTSLTLGLSF